MPTRAPGDLDWTNPDWMTRAACASAPVQEMQSVDATIAMCRNCPVISPCLSFALARDEPYGVWGGLTYEDRRTLRRSRDAESTST